MPLSPDHGGGGSRDCQWHEVEIHPAWNASLLKGNLESTVQILDYFVFGGRKQETLEKTRMSMGRKCNEAMLPVMSAVALAFISEFMESQQLAIPGT